MAVLFSCLQFLKHFVSSCDDRGKGPVSNLIITGTTDDCDEDDQLYAHRANMVIGTRPVLDYFVRSNRKVTAKFNATFPTTHQTRSVFDFFIELPNKFAKTNNSSRNTSAASSAIACALNNASRQPAPILI